MIKSIAFGIFASVLVAAPAMAAPITTQPTAPTGLGGNVSLVFIGSDAGDTSSLSFGSSTDLFCNHASGSCGAASAGQVADLGNQSGVLNFQLKDLTVANTFDLLNTSTDGDYHANVSSNYADLGVFNISSAATDAIAALTQQGGIVSYVGFEDRIGGDYDYNDFVFAVIVNPAAPTDNQSDGDITITTTQDDPQVDANPVPEPASIALLGAGLLGLRKRRKARR